MTRRPPAPLALVAVALLGACGDPPGAPSAPPEVDLGGLAVPARGVPDPCQILETAGAPQLLAGTLDEQPIRAPGFCLVQVARGEERAPQESVALELTTRSAPAPANLDDYLAEFGEGVHIAGAEPTDVQTLAGLGDFAVWFPHADGALTLSSFWRDGYFLSVEIHGVDRERALAWSRDLATQIVRRVGNDERRPG